MKLDKLITESIEKFLKENIITKNGLLTESYGGKLYHFTSIGLAYDIMKDNVIYTREDSSRGQIDRRMRDKDNSDLVVSLSRNGTFGDGYEKNYGISVRFTIDGEKLLNAHNKHFELHPYNYSGFPERIKNYDFDPENLETGLPFITVPGKNVTVFGNGKWLNDSEFEERLYNHDIYPLDRYCERIDILVRNIAETDDSEVLWYKDFDYVPTYSGHKEHDAQVNKEVIDKMLNMPRWKEKTFVHYNDKKYVTAFEIGQKKQ